VANEYGFFRISGVAPGHYILTGWLDEPFCEIYDPDDLETCRATGIEVDILPASQASLVLNVKPSRR
jgi:hypothetical protein